jgi:hypothetical protein
VSVGISTQPNGILIVGNDGAWWAHAEGLPDLCKAIKLGSDVELTTAACERAAKMMVTSGEKKVCIDLSYGAHAMGSCRMGHEVKNLFICGTRAFITGSGLNPALTAMEVASRSAELAHGILPTDEGDAGALAVQRVPDVAERMQLSPYGQTNVSTTEVGSESSNNMIADVGTTWGTPQRQPMGRLPAKRLWPWRRPQRPRPLHAGQIRHRQLHLNPSPQLLPLFPRKPNRLSF